MGKMTRRDAMLSLGAAASLAARASCAAGSGASGFVPSAPMDVYAKIRCSLSDELVPFWYRGQAMVALQNDIPRPILGVEGFSYTRFSRNTDGSWLTKLIEVGYFTDLATGQVVDEIVNRVTGLRIKPQHFISPVQAFGVNVDGSVTSDHTLPPPSEFVGRVWQPLRQGTEIWVDEDMLARLPSDMLPPTIREPGPSRMLTLGSMTTYRSSVADVNNPRVARAPCTFHLQELASMPGWFGMGDVVGKQMWRLSGRKLPSIAEIPALLRVRIERDHPDFISKPGI